MNRGVNEIFTCNLNIIPLNVSQIEKSYRLVRLYIYIYIYISTRHRSTTIAMPMGCRRCSTCAAHSSGVSGFGGGEKSSAAVEDPR